MKFPFAGIGMLQGLSAQEGFKVKRLHVATLMRRMGIKALYRQTKRVDTDVGAQDLPLSAKKASHHPAQPGLDDGHHFHSLGLRVHLSGAALDWITRRILVWRVSTTLEATFCVEA